MPIDVVGAGPWNIENRKMEYHERCLNSKSNNNIFCPQKIIKRKVVQSRDKVPFDFDYIKSLGGKSKKSNLKRKNEEKEKQEEDEKQEEKEKQGKDEKQEKDVKQEKDAKQEKDEKQEKEEKGHVVLVIAT